MNVQAMATQAPASLNSRTTGDKLTPLARIEEAGEFNPDLPYLAVTHEAPDTDAMVCLWFIKNLIALPAGRDFDWRFVRSGERLSIVDGTGYNVIHVDTGFGRFDQHGMQMERGSSFELLAEHFGYADEPGIRELVELTRATDNVEKVDPCSLHYFFKGLRGTVKKEDGRTPDWETILHHVFVALSSLHSHHCMVAKGDENFKAKGQVEELRNGVKLCVNLFQDIHQEAAFRAGVNVMVWCKKKKGKMMVGVQSDGLRLGNLCAALRLAEAQARNITLTASDLNQLGTLEHQPTWFAHRSNKLILAGSLTHIPKDDEYTQLSPSLIAFIARAALSNPSMSPDKVVRLAREERRKMPDQKLQPKT